MGTSSRPDPDAVAHVLFRCRRQLWWASHRRLAADGETMWEWQMLAHARLGPQSQAQLAEATAQHPTAVSRLLSDLEAQGLVQRSRDSDDRRRVLVELTPAGRARYAALAGPVWGAMAEHLAVLDGTERAELHRLLSKVLGANEAPPAAVVRPRTAPRTTHHARTRRTSR